MVSIITPSYNQSLYLPYCLRSIEIQRLTADIEHLVIDGGSKDGSVDILENCKTQPDYWQSSPDGGQSAAINHGISSSKGNILCWINSDDGLVTGACAHMESLLGSAKEPLWAIGACRIIGEDNFQTDTWRPIPGIHDELTAVLNWRENYLMQPAVFWNRAMWKVAGPLIEDMHYAMDFDLWLRFFTFARPILITEEIGIHRQQGQSKTSQVGSEIYAEYRRSLEKRLNCKKTLLSLGLRDLAANAALAANRAIFFENLPLSRRCLREALRASNTALLQPHFIKAIVKNFLALLRLKF